MADQPCTISARISCLVGVFWCVHCAGVGSGEGVSDGVIAGSDGKGLGRHLEGACRGPWQVGLGGLVSLTLLPMCGVGERRNGLNGFLRR
jgi:hypothetical protein